MLLDTNFSKEVIHRNPRGNFFAQDKNKHSCTWKLMSQSQCELTQHKQGKQAEIHVSNIPLNYHNRWELLGG